MALFERTAVAFERGRKMLIDVCVNGGSVVLQYKLLSLFLADPTSLQTVQNIERPKLKLAEFMSE